MAVKQRERKATEIRKERGGRKVGAELEEVVKRRKHQHRSTQGGAAQRCLERLMWADSLE